MENLQILEKIENFFNLDNALDHAPPTLTEILNEADSVVNELEEPIAFGFSESHLPFGFVILDGKVGMSLQYLWKAFYSSMKNYEYVGDKYEKISSTHKDVPKLKTSMEYWFNLTMQIEIELSKKLVLQYPPEMTNCVNFCLVDGWRVAGSGSKIFDTFLAWGED